MHERNEKWGQNGEYNWIVVSPQGSVRICKVKVNDQGWVMKQIAPKEKNSAAVFVHMGQLDEHTAESNLITNFQFIANESFRCKEPIRTMTFHQNDHKVFMKFQLHIVKITNWQVQSTIFYFCFSHLWNSFPIQIIFFKQ